MKPKTLALIVRELRRANRLTQNQLALLAGVGRRFVSDLENAKTTLRLEKVDAVLSVFGKHLEIGPRPKGESTEWAAADE